MPQPLKTCTHIVASQVCTFLYERRRHTPYSVLHRPYSYADARFLPHLYRHDDQHRRGHADVDDHSADDRGG